MDTITVEEVVRRTLGWLHGAGLPAWGSGPPIAVPVGVSNRHVHLSLEHVRALFGPEASLSRLRDLSQPGQFVAGETVQLAGPNGALTHVRVLGPPRRETQVEVCRTDAYRLGLRPPVRDSGELEGTPGAVLLGPAGTVVLARGVILAARHIHLTPDEAGRLGLHDRQQVDVEVTGPRAGVMRRVLVRVSDRFVFELHVDTDEANAYSLQNGDTAWLLPPFHLPPPALGSATDEAPPEVALALVTERDVAGAAARNGRLILQPGALVTPLARDAAHDLKVALVTAGG